MLCGAGLKRCTLELGGKSAAVVLDDFELTDASARMLVNGAMVNAGQVCAAQTRVLVPRARHDEIVAAMAEATRALGRRPAVRDDRHRPADLAAAARPGRALHQVGVEEGATLAAGGGRPAIEPGWYVQPTLFAAVDNAMTIAREEIFGPVAAVIPYRDEAEAIALANDSEYGLAGAVWTATRAGASPWPPGSGPARSRSTHPARSTPTAVRRVQELRVRPGRRH